MTCWPAIGLGAPNVRDVSLGVGDRGPVGHEPDRASPRTANGERPGTGLGRDHTIFATAEGTVQFKPARKGRTVSVVQE